VQGLFCQVGKSLDGISIFIVMSGLTLFMIAEGIKALFKIPNYFNMMFEADQIFNTRIFEEITTVKNNFIKYFNDLDDKINTVFISLVFSYTMVSLMLSTLTPGSSVGHSFLVVLLFYLGPFGISLLVVRDIFVLKKEVDAKINDLDGKTNRQTQT